MNDRNRLTRRQVVQGALGAVAMVAGAPLLAAEATPTQTEGPFFPKKDQADKDLDLTRVEGRSEAALGEVIEIGGQVMDETGAPSPVRWWTSGRPTATAATTTNPTRTRPRWTPISRAGRA